MKSSEHIYTHTRFGIDTRVWLTMVTLVIFSFGLLAYKLIDSEPCKPMKIVTKGYRAGMENSFYLGEKVEFSAQGAQQDVAWDFGDHSEEQRGKTVTHVFQREGNYVVSVGADEKCMESLTISISRIPQPTYNLDIETQNPITGPDITRVGEPVKLVCSRIASAYEWTVLNNPNYPLQHSNIASYTFTTPGTITVVLKLDNDVKKEYKRTLQVLPPMKMQDNFPAGNNTYSGQQPNPYAAAHSPREKEKEPNEKENTEEAPAKPKAIIIPDQEFVNLFKQVTQEKKELEYFDQFLCNGAQTKVLINDENWETVGSFYAKIRGKRKYDIQSVQAVRDEQYCVKLLKIKSKKRGFLGL